MNVTIACVHCGKLLNAPRELAGKRVRCVHCQSEFVLPGTFEAAPTLLAPRPPLKKPVGPRDDTLSRSMLLPMPSLEPVAAEEMLCRLWPGSLRWLFASKSVQEFLGTTLEQLREQVFLECLHPDDRALAEDEFRQVVERGERHDFVLRMRGGHGPWHYMRFYTQARYDPDGRLNHLRCILKDVTDHVRAEQELRRRTEQLTAANEQHRRMNERLREAQGQLVHSEKLAALGTLAAGMAHEINNPLAYTTNNVAVLERDLGALLHILARYQDGRAALRGVRPELDDEIAALEEALDLPYLQENLPALVRSTRKGLGRVAQIVRNLRGFARLDQSEIGEMDVNQSIEQGLGMLGDMLARQQIRVERDYAALPPLEGAAANLNQVFLNLMMNGMQAIEATGRGSGLLRIATRHDGEGVVVEVADDGCGIPPDVLPKIFDPFFTTKAVGRGTGLGLSISHGIVAEHGGRIEVESAPGAGSRFVVHLPPRRRRPPATDPDVGVVSDDSTG